MIIEPGNHCREKEEERGKGKRKRKKRKKKRKGDQGGKGNRSDKPGVLVNEPVGGQGGA
jgi:hypothetical protein